MKRNRILYIILALVLLFVLDILPFRKIGFYCGDPKISYKFNGDTVSMGVLFGGTLAIPLVGLGVVECISYKPEESYKTEKKKDLKGVKLTWHWYSRFLLGLTIVIFITEAAKSLVSEPRPHFLDTCRPDKAVNCSSGYISNFECTNTRLSRFYVKDSFRSFPSGHSAIGVYTAIFMMWFFQKRIPDSSYLIIPWLQCLCAFWGMTCALTRITDHRHHWWDVLAGAVCGIAVAAFTVHTYCKGFYLQDCKVPSTDKNSKDIVNGVRHQSARRLLSSTSSYSPPDDRELREVQMT